MTEGEPHQPSVTTAPARTFHAVPVTHYAWFVDAFGNRRIFPVVGYYDDGTDTVAAVLFTEQGRVRSVGDLAATMALVSMVDSDDTVPGKEALDRAHQNVADSRITAAWSEFHSTRPHDACGHVPPDGWWDSHPDDEGWGPGSDTAEAAELRASLAKRFRLDAKWAGCPHEFVDCAVEFCGRAAGSDGP